MELKRLTIETELNNYLVPTLPLTLRKLDRNVHVVMDIANSILEVQDDLVVSFSITNPTGTKFKAHTEGFVKDGLVHIILTKECFDSEFEIGMNTVELRFYDAHRQSTVALPPYRVNILDCNDSCLDGDEVTDALLTQEELKLMTENQLCLAMDKAIKITDLEETTDIQGFTVVSTQDATYKLDVSQFVSDDDVQAKMDEVKQYVDEQIANIPPIDLSEYATIFDIDYLDMTKANKVHSHTVAEIDGLDVPTKLSELENDCGFIDEIPSIYVTEPQMEVELSKKANKVDFNTLKQEVTYARNTYTSLDARLDAMDAEASTHAKKSEIGTLVQTELDAELPNMVANEVQGQLNNYVTENELNTALNSKANTDDLRATNQTVGNLSTQVQTLNTSVNNKASKADLTNLTSRVTANENDIDGLQQSNVTINNEIRNIKNNMGEVNVQADWTVTDTTSDAYIKNKPNMNNYATKNETGALANLTTSNKVNLVNAINEVKTLAEQPSGEYNVQSDWNETNAGSDAFIKNKPIIPTNVEQLQGIDKYALETSLQELVKEVVDARTMSPYVFANLKDRLDAMGTGGGGGGIAPDLTNYYTKSQTDTKIQEMLVNSQTLKYELVDTLPMVGKANTVYLLAVQGSQSRQQWMYLEGSFKLLGTTEVDLTDYYTKAEVYNKDEMDATLGNATLTTTAQTIKGAINELDNDVKEVVQARTDVNNVIHANLKARLDADCQEVIRARTDKDGITHTNLKEHFIAIEDNVDEIEEVIGDETQLETKAKIVVDAINELQAQLDLKVGGNGTPVGGIVPFTGTVIPNGFLYCRGQEVSRVDYAELFEVIGTTYGEGDGVETFNVPNLQGRIPVGLDVNQELSTDIAQALGEIGGNFKTLLSIENLPSHKHDFVGDSHAHTFTGGLHSHTFTGESHTHTFTGTSHNHNLGSGVLTSESTNVISNNGPYIPKILNLTSSQNDGQYDGIRLYRDNGDYENKSDVDWNYTTSVTVTDSSTAGGTVGSATTSGTVNSARVSGTVEQSSISGTITETGGNEEFSNTQPYLTVDYIICYTKATKFSSEIIKWLPLTHYEQGMMVYSNGNIYKCKESHDSTNDFFETKDKWEVIVTGGDQSLEDMKLEVANARKDLNNKEYATLKERIDAIEVEHSKEVGDLTTLLTDEKNTVVGAINELHDDFQEVIDARTDAENNVFANLKARLDNDKQEVLDARKDALDKEYATLRERLNSIDEDIKQNADDIEEINNTIGDLTTLTTDVTDTIVGAINSMDRELDYARTDIDGKVYTTFSERINELETASKECEEYAKIIGDKDTALDTTANNLIDAINELKADIGQGGEGGQVHQRPREGKEHLRSPLS